MVIRILTGKDVSGSVRYNEKKVAQGLAECIQIANYPDSRLAHKQVRFRQQFLEQYAKLNPNVAKPAVHLAIAFHPSESLSKDLLRKIGDEVMEEAGYKNQPYLIYAHNDTRHPHIHVVSVSIDADGNRIRDSYIKNRLHQIRRKIEINYKLVQAEPISTTTNRERVGEGVNGKVALEKPITTIVEEALKMNSFASVKSFQYYLKSRGIEMSVQSGETTTGISFQARNKKGALSRPVKASDLWFKPTYNRLIDKFYCDTASHNQKCKQLESILDRYLPNSLGKSEKAYKDSLLQIGIEVVNIDTGYLYIQNQKGLVTHESELGISYSKQALMEQIAKKAFQQPSKNYNASPSYLPIKGRRTNPGQKSEGIEQRTNKWVKPARKGITAECEQTQPALAVPEKAGTREKNNSVERPAEVTKPDQSDRTGWVNKQRKKRERKSPRL